MILARVSLPHGRIRQHHCTTNRQAGTCGGEKGSPHRGPRFLQALINGQTCTAGMGLEKKAVRKGRSNAGKKGKAKGFRKADMTARDLSEAEARMQRFMDQRPDFVFRPREAVPEDMQAAYDVLGESGPQFWKSLRHHLRGMLKRTLHRDLCSSWQSAHRGAWIKRA